jgi:hypothetical protein
MVAADYPNLATSFATCDLSVGDLAHVLGGCLNLGTMPPLGGAWEPVGRLIAAGQRIQSGDVVMVGIDQMRNGRGQPLGAVQATCAFAGGALGVISTRGFVEPWAGRFSLYVDDATALGVALNRAVARGWLVPLTPPPAAVSPCFDKGHIVRKLEALPCVSTLRDVDTTLPPG